jgi:hypothetical protein
LNEPPKPKNCPKYRGRNEVGWRIKALIADIRITAMTEVFGMAWRSDNV